MGEVEKNLLCYLALQHRSEILVSLGHSLQGTCLQLSCIEMVDGEKRSVVKDKRRKMSVLAGAAAVERGERRGEGQTVAVNVSRGSSCVSV